MGKMPIPEIDLTKTIDEGVLRSLMTAYSYGCTDSEAALYAGIGVSTLYKYQKDNPQFIEIKQELRKNPVLYARQCLLNNIKDNPTISLKILEKLAKEYKQTQEVRLDSESFELTLNKLRKSDITDKENTATENKSDPTDTPTDDPEPTGG